MESLFRKLFPRPGDDVKRILKLMESHTTIVCWKSSTRYLPCFIPGALSIYVGERGTICYDKNDRDLLLCRLTEIANDIVNRRNRGDFYALPQNRSYTMQNVNGLEYRGNAFWIGCPTSNQSYNIALMQDSDSDGRTFSTCPIYFGTNTYAVVRFNYGDYGALLIIHNGSRIETYKVSNLYYDNSNGAIEKP